jgi:hypothetical protein
MRLDLERVRANVRSATTQDLLDRATVFREDMEPEALEIIGAELGRRGVTPGQIADHEKWRKQTAISRPDGSPAQCSCCRQPAVASAWGWHKMWGRIPLFPRFFYYCAEHRPKTLGNQSPER